MNLLGRNFRQVILRVSLVSLVVCVVNLLMYKMDCLYYITVISVVLYTYAIVEACMLAGFWLEQRKGNRKSIDYLYAFLQFNAVLIPPSIVLWLMGPGAFIVVLIDMAMSGYHG